MSTRTKGDPAKVWLVPHPGEDLQEWLDERHMSIKEFAIKSGKPEKTIIAVTKGHSSITPDMAIAFEMVSGVPASYWLNRQRGYDEFEARKKRESVLHIASDWARQFPYSAMTKLGWVPDTRSSTERAQNLLLFFGLTSPEAWENYYLRSTLPTAFRISLKHSHNPAAISAWLRKGESDAGDLHCAEFDKVKLRAALPWFKGLMANPPKDWFIQLQEACLECGVKLVHTPCLPKAPVNGAVRHVGSAALIQISGRQNRYDIFWFTFFHEVGHLLLHGTKDIFIDGDEVGNVGGVADKEREADDFAVRWTLSVEEEEQLMSTVKIEQGYLNRISRKLGTHPSIIVGRMHHTGRLHPSRGRDFLKTLEFC